MFGWFQPQCPVDIAAKHWIEDRLHWLGKEFGNTVFLKRAFILPTRDFFPDPIDGSLPSLRNLLDQVCGYMDADPSAVELELYVAQTGLTIVNDRGEHLPTGAAGTYEDQGDKVVIRIDKSQVHDLTSLVGTMAHELAHLRLLGEGRLHGDEFDNELLTDLTVVFHGLGIFLANSPRNWLGISGSWPETELRRPEYMTAQMFGYALALAAWCRNETKPEWARHLAGDAKICFRYGLKFLLKTGDSKFRPRHLSR